jgi:DHA2 family multidrug resistance protein
MGFGDAFFMLTVFYFGLIMLLVFLKRPAGLLSEPGH